MTLNVGCDYLESHSLLGILAMSLKRHEERGERGCHEADDRLSLHQSVGKEAD